MLAAAVVPPPSWWLDVGLPAGLFYVQSFWKTLALGYILAAAQLTRPDSSRLQPDLDTVGPRQDAFYERLPLFSIQELPGMISSSTPHTVGGHGVQRLDRLGL